MQPTWRVLARRIEKKLLPGFVRFQAGKIRQKRLEVLAFYRGAAPSVPGFTITVDGKQVLVDIKTKSLPPAAPLGITGVRFTGVHPGAPIAVDIGGNAHELGGICALLAKAPEANEPTHFVTCGHVFRPQSKKTTVIGGMGNNKQPIGTLVTNLLDRTQARRDVALVELTPQGRTWARAGGPGPKLDSYLPANRIFLRDSRTFKPTTGASSHATTTNDTITNARINFWLWPGGFDVVGAIATSSVVSQPGDSGTVLATLPDDSPHVTAIASCSAGDGAESLFEPLGRAIDDVFEPRYQLTLWRNP